MPRHLDQLPSDPTTLARKIAALERQVKELRAARRMGAATVGTLRVYAEDGTTLLAEIGPSEDGGGGLTTWGLAEIDDSPSVARLSSGRLRFQAADEGLTAVPAYAAYTAFPGTGCDLALSSGSVNAGDWASVVDLTSVTDGETPTVLIAATREIGGVGESGDCNLTVEGALTVGSLAFGQAAITPSAANTPTSVNVTGLNVKGSTFLGYASATTAAPGSQVTGASATAVTSSGLTVWVTRTNTNQTFVNWMVVGL